MPSSDELNAAVGAGVIGRAEADRLAAFLAEYQKTAVSPMDGEAEDSESIRFVRGFHDVFLTIGVTLLLVGVGYTSELVGDLPWPFAIAIASWALAEYFTRIKKLTLPSIALSIAFGIGGGYALLVFSPLLLPAGPDSNLVVGTPRDVLPAMAANMLPAASILLASALFYLRFRLPFTLAQMVVAAATAVALFLKDHSALNQPVFLAMGALTFALALYFDFKDPERRTIAADNAFWLHLTAAPLIVHTSIGYIWTSEISALTLSSALVTIGLIVSLAIVALLIDRRAILVAGLFYFGAALFIIIRNTAIEEGTVFALTILLLGGALVLLGVGWRSLRAAIINNLLPPDLARRLPTLRTS
jgi:hypothetical protein